MSSDNNTYTGSYSGISYPSRPDVSADAYLKAMGVSNPNIFDHMFMSDSHYNQWSERLMDQYNIALKEAELQYNSYQADLERRLQAGLNPYWNDYSGSGTSGFGNSVPTSDMVKKEPLSSKDYISSAIQLLSMVGSLAQQGANVRKTDAETNYLIASQPNRLGLQVEDLQSKNLQNAQTLYDLYGFSGVYPFLNIPSAGTYQSPSYDSNYVKRKSNEIDLQKLLKTSRSLDNTLSGFDVHQKKEFDKAYESIVLPSLLKGYQADTASSQAIIDNAEVQKKIQTYSPAIQTAISLIQTIIGGISQFQRPRR